ncbi:MAG: NfeD family protein [Marinifilaceae bacterium]|jgi:membrane protein implicated in regulation of membrane protease activity
MDIEIWHIWFIGSIVFFILEIFLPSFVAVCLGAGALIAGIAAFVGMEIETQLLVFSIVTVVSVFLIRPLMLKFARKRSDTISTNAEGMIGRKGIVCEAIGPKPHSGRVSIDGDNWKAISETGELIQMNTEVMVTQIDSIIITVKPISNK